MLRACRRLLKPGGRIAFFTIVVAPGLTPRDHRRAVRSGPRAVASKRPQRELLEAARLGDIEETDVTAAFLDTAKAWLEHALRLQAPLREILGDEEFEQVQADRRATIAAIEEGLLRRSLFAAIRRA